MSGAVKLKKSLFNVTSQVEAQKRMVKFFNHKKVKQEISDISYLQWGVSYSAT